MDELELPKLTNFDCILPNLKTYKEKKSRGSKIIIVGKPGSGKSTLLKALLKSKSDIIKIGIAMSGSEGANDFYKEFFPGLFVYDEYDDSTLVKVIERQKEIINSKYVDEAEKWMTLILDDCADQSSVFRQQIQKTLFKNGSHYKLLYILCMQFALDMPLNIRTAVDGVFLFRETNLDSLKLLHINYGGVIPSFDLFKQLMTSHTGNHQCLYINNSMQSNNWRDCVFVCKAEIVDSEWKFGSTAFRDWHESRFNPDWDDPQAMINLDIKELTTA
jgi:hypothetical protein